MSSKPGRNDPCPCGSGRKFKACCGNPSAPRAASAQPKAPVASTNPATLRALMREAQAALTSGRLPQAMAALHKVVTLDPRAFEPLLQLGNLLLNAGRPAEALQYVDRGLNLQPRSAPAHVMRGIAQEQLGHHSEAHKAYEQAIAIDPRHAEAHARLGVLHTMREDKDAAAASYRKAAKSAPHTSLGRLCEAYALTAEGNVEEAQHALRKLIAMEPNNSTAHTALGKLLAEAGQAEAAWTAFEKAVRLEPRAAGQYYDLVRIRRFRESDRPVLQRMLDTAQRRDLHDLNRIMLELAIGRAYDDLNDPEHAMQHYLGAGAFKARLRPLDRERIRTSVDWAINTFTPDFFVRHQHLGSSDATPLIVLGMPRSGTTLTESILSSHSLIGAGQELPFWGRIAEPCAMSNQIPDEASTPRIAQDYLAALRALSPAPHVVDKKPQNFLWAGLIHTVFPRARIIHCRRHPLDTCVSVVSNYFAPGRSFSTEANDLVFYYREYERLMAHWRNVLPADRFLEIDYETLVTTPEPTIRQLIAFCGLDWEAACLHPEQNTRSVNTASLWQVRQPISAGSVGRWQRYGPWLGPLAALDPATSA